MTNIFVANLDFGITSDDLRATFSQFGEVEYAHVVYDNKTKKSKGYGYVEMPSSENAIAAVSTLNGIEVNGRVLDIKIATPKNERVTKPKEDNKFNKPKREGFKANKPYDKGQTPFNKGERSDDGFKPKENRVMRPRRKRMDD